MLMSLIIHPHVILNLLDLHSSSEHKLSYTFYEIRELSDPA